MTRILFQSQCKGMIFYLFNKHFLFFFVVLSVYVQKTHLIYKERLKFVQADIILIELIWRYVLHMQKKQETPYNITLGCQLFC